MLCVDFRVSNGLWIGSIIVLVFSRMCLVMLVR